MTSVSVAIPSRGRSEYLEVALASIAPQAAALGVDLLVVLDGPDPASAGVAERHGAKTLTQAPPAGANAARNAALTALSAGGTEVVIFCDDDVEAPSGWLDAFLRGIDANPDHEAFGGPISARLEGGPRCCGAEPAPITTLALGPEDRDCDHVWSANMAVRASAVSRIGAFDERIHGRGEEEEWLDRLRADGGRVRYLAAAGLIHRRAGADAALAQLSRADYHLGRSARANDVRKGATPSLARELRDLAGAGWHTLAKRCAYGVVFGAHALGRIAETLDPTPLPSGDGEFTSGLSGYVAGTRAISAARIADAVADTRGLLSHRRLARDAASWSRRQRVQVLALERENMPSILDAAVAELLRSRHEVRVARSGIGARGRFENLNRLLSTDGVDLARTDWLIIMDDDVALPRGFLDRFLFLADRHRLTLAQPAHRRFSHAAWPVTRRRSGSVLRETAFVEIGPLVAFHRDAFAALLPFPELQVGWGVDAYWGALAAERGWRVGVIDATAISHALRPVAASYDQSAALAESRAFLAAHPHITPAQAARTLQTHRSW